MRLILLFISLALAMPAQFRYAMNPHTGRMDIVGYRAIQDDGTTISFIGRNVAISPTLPVTVATVSPQAVERTGFFFNNAAGAMTFTLPAITAATIGNQYCFRNYVGKSGAITIQLPAATSVDVDGVNGTAAGTLVSGGALGDSACVVAVAVGQYMAYIGTGVWTNN